jgi:hypothetical protein
MSHKKDHTSADRFNRQSYTIAYYKSGGLIGSRLGGPTWKESAAAAAATLAACGGGLYFTARDIERELRAHYDVYHWSHNVCARTDWFPSLVRALESTKKPRFFSKTARVPDKEAVYLLIFPMHLWRVRPGAVPAVAASAGDAAATISDLTPGTPLTSAARLAVDAAIEGVAYLLSPSAIVVKQTDAMPQPVAIAGQMRRPWSTQNKTMANLGQVVIPNRKRGFHDISVHPDAQSFPPPSPLAPGPPAAVSATLATTVPPPQKYPASGRGPSHTPVSLDADIPGSAEILLGNMPAAHVPHPETQRPQPFSSSAPAAIHRVPTTLPPIREMFGQYLRWNPAPRLRR